MRCLVAQPLLAVLVLLVAGPARADVAPEPLAATADPHLMDAAAQGISMKREEVTVELFDAYAIVDATFVMANPGPGRTLQVGFPGENVFVGKQSTVHRALVGFSAWVDGQPAPSAARDVTHEVSAGPPGSESKRTRHETWHVFDAAFPAKGEAVLRVRYGVVADPYLGDSYSSREHPLDSSVHYVLATGARWAGPIGEAVVKVRARGGVKPGSIRIRSMDMPPLVKATDPNTPPPPVLPAYGTRDPDGVTLRQTNLKPDGGDDLQIVFRPDPARVPPRQGFWDARPATEALRKALGVKPAAPGR